MSEPKKKAAVETLADWTNQDSREFYDHLSKSVLTFQAIKAGIGNAEDFQALKPLLEQLPMDRETEVLEIGGGDGRMVAHFLKHFPQIQVTALERSQQNLDTLHQRFGGWRNIKIWADDLSTAETSHRFHMAFWMFAGIAEFHPSERASVLQKVASWLIPSGLLFLDMVGTIPGTLSSKGFPDGFREYYAEGQTLKTHIPTLEQLTADAIKAGFEVVGTVDYDSGQRLTRHILVLKKPAHE